MPEILFMNYFKLDLYLLPKYQPSIIAIIIVKTPEIIPFGKNKFLTMIATNKNIATISKILKKILFHVQNLHNKNSKKIDKNYNL